MDSNDGLSKISDDDGAPNGGAHGDPDVLRLATGAEEESERPADVAGVDGALVRRRDCEGVCAFHYLGTGMELSL